jgi:putative salt-induced outer membrane protein YdiY
VLFLLWGTSGLASSLSYADTVTLDNGDRLSGRLISLNGETLELATAYAGTLTVSRARLRQISTDEAVQVELGDGTRLDGILKAEGDQLVRLRIGRLAETRPLPLSQVAAINPPDTQRTTRRARLALGGSVASGNTDAHSLHLAGEAEARNDVQRTTLDAEINEASQDGVETASNWQLGMKYDYFVAPQTYLYVNTRFEHDSQADLDLRSALGLGAGRQIVDRPDLSLAIEGGLSAVNEDYGSATDTRFPGARFALNYEQALWAERVRLFHNSNVLLSLESADNYLYRSRTGLRMPVNEHFGVGTQVNFDYDNVPAIGAEKTDTALIFNLDYTL